MKRFCIYLMSRLGWSAVVAVALAFSGCAGAAGAKRATAGGGVGDGYGSEAENQDVQFDVPAPAIPRPVPQQEVMLSSQSYSLEAELTGDAPPAPAHSATARNVAGGWDTGEAQEAPLFAQAPGTPPTPTDAVDEAPPVEGGGEESAKVATDGRAGPLLIYEATLWMAVYEVDQKQAEVIALVQELGGFLSTQTGHRLVVRVPADRFQDAIDRMEKIGDVVDRNIQAQDVTDRFRDLSLRLKNAVEVRDRLAELLAKAQGVQDSLEIERELDRITERIETLKGQLKSLSDRIAFSTITIEFGVRPQPSIDPEFNLPFHWLQSLGLDTLLAL